MINSENSRTCFSHEGEDVLLEYILGNINFAGSFLDIGAHHPIKFSNTYKFYLSGWRGINIEARPGSSLIFNELRPGDINLEIPVSDKEEELIYHIFNYPELNSFSDQHVFENDGLRNLKVIEKVKLKTLTISTILKKYWKPTHNFDLLSLDVEGLDLRILKSIDFKSYLFNFIIVEDKLDIEDLQNGRIFNLLISEGYKLYSKLFYSTIYYFDYSSEHGKTILDPNVVKCDPKSFNMSSWVLRFVAAINEIKSLLPKTKKIILADQGEWRLADEIDGKEIIPFPENNGQYWGLPANDEQAIEEIERQREMGVTSIIFGWATFRWLDHYKGMK
ncbi:MAG: FkbM family methyltransferase, partial [Ignavibacteria bacterium]|nr:FkbM family methyltransferase [Ignavibacteria bacterium]